MTTRWTAGARWTHAHHTMERDDDAPTERVEEQPRGRRLPSRHRYFEQAQRVLKSIDQGARKRDAQ